MTHLLNNTSSRRAKSARPNPFLALANEIEGNRWWVDSLGEWELRPEDNQRRRKVRVCLADALRTPAAHSERGTGADAAAILGLKPRKLQAMSQRGEIPSAAKLGRQWTYDLAKLRRFVEQQEQACQNEKPRPAATGGGKFSGAKFRLKASGSGGRLGQMIRQSQRRAAKQAKNAH